jgi:hypothetical protein
MQAGTNYIYILFAVAYAVYSIIKAGKKVTANRPTIDKDQGQSPAVKPPTESPIPNAGDDMKKMLQDLLGGSPEEKTPEAHPDNSRELRPQPVFERPKHQQPVPHHMEHTKTVSHTFDKAKAQAIQEKHVDKPKTVPKKIFAESTADNETTPDFDIRQAIIYSEILKRPEY